MKKLPFILVVVLFLSSCSFFHPVKIKKISLPGKFPSHPGAKFSKTELCRPWWEEFGDSNLNNLILQALKNNKDLEILSFKIKELNALSKIERSAKLPHLDLSSTGELTWFNKTPHSTGHEQTIKNPEEAYTLQLTTSYEVDLWKKITNSYKSALYKTFSAEWNKKALEISISAEVANYYYKIAYLSKKISILKNEIKLHKKFFKIMKSRYKKGLVELSSIKEAKITTLEKEYLLTTLKKELYTTRTKLGILLGTFKLPHLAPQLPSKLPPIPSYLPSDLLKNRPDIIEVEYEIKALNCEYLSRLAQRFPKISLTGAGGSKSTELKELFSSSNFLWKLAFETAFPIFNYGKLKAMAEEKKWEVKEAAAKYAKTVLNAFWEVEEALANEKLLKTALALKKESLKLRKELLDIAQKRYEKGLLDLNELLKRKISFLQAKEELVDARYALITNRIFLYKALGGGIQKCPKELCK